MFRHKMNGSSTSQHGNVKHERSEGVRDSDYRQRLRETGCLRVRVPAGNRCTDTLTVR